jgi:hypothetical protein
LLAIEPGPRQPTRRALLLALAAAGLSGCAHGDNIIWQHLKLLRRVGGSSGGLKREDVAKFPAASIAARLGGGREVLILLDRIEGRDYFWLSTDYVMLVTRGGRLMQTAGFANDLARTTLPAPDPVDGGLLGADRQNSLRLLDYEDFGTGVPATSKYRVVKKDPLTIIGSTIPTVRVIERVQIRPLKWYFTNTYWVHEETGQVWRSRQRFHPDHPALTITTMRPAHA